MPACPASSPAAFSVTVAHSNERLQRQNLGTSDDNEQSIPTCRRPIPAAHRSGLYISCEIRFADRFISSDKS
jgi:hypothetical protein